MPVVTVDAVCGVDHAVGVVEHRDERPLVERGAGVRHAADEHVADAQGAARLGEVALVDGEGRIGRLGTTFFDTLLDENAASHIALGQSYSFTAGPEDQANLNRSAIHVDFMIGGDDVAVSGVTADGDEVPVLRGGVWQI